MKRLKESVITFLKGIASPLIAIFVFALTIGLFLSLTLLVISIEEGTGSFSDSAMSIMCATLMLAQGVGLGLEGLVITVTPLGLTFLLIAFLAYLIRKFKGSIPVYIIGFVCWIIINVIIYQNTSIELLDSLPIVLLKTSLIYVISICFAVIPHSDLINSLYNKFKQYINPVVPRIIKLSVVGALLTVLVYTIVSCIAVIVWSFVGYENVESFFTVLGMQQGSRILTTIACLAWLPNIALWALSWICGAGFSVGSVAHFAIGVAKYKQMPPVPVFGIFPHAISNHSQQMLVLSAVPAALFVLSLVILFLKKGCNIRVHISDKQIDYKKSLIDFGVSAVVLVCVASLSTIVMNILFNCCNGSLGQYRLKNIGVKAVESVQAVGHYTLLPFIAAWLVSLVGICLAYLILWLFNVIKDKYFSHNKDSVHNKDSEKSKSKLRTIANKHDANNSAVDNSSVNKSTSNKFGANKSTSNKSGANRSVANSSDSNKYNEEYFEEVLSEEVLSEEVFSEKSDKESLEQKSIADENISDKNFKNKTLSSKRNVPRTIRSKAVKK